MLIVNPLTSILSLTLFNCCFLSVLWDVLWPQCGNAQTGRWTSCSFFCSPPSCLNQTVPFWNVPPSGPESHSVVTGPSNRSNRLSVALVRVLTGHVGAKYWEPLVLSSPLPLLSNRQLCYRDRARLTAPTLTARWTARPPHVRSSSPAPSLGLSPLTA